MAGGDESRLSLLLLQLLLDDRRASILPVPAYTILTARRFP